MSKNTQYPVPEVLRELYCDKHMGYTKVAALMNVSPRSVGRWIKKAGITPMPQLRYTCIPYRVPHDLAERLGVPDKNPNFQASKYIMRCPLGKVMQ